VICVDDGLLAHQIVLPLFDILYQGIQLLVIIRLFEDFPMKYFRMIVDMSSSLHDNYAHEIPTCICLHFKGIMQVW
jgi:hypothetical protein